MHFSNVHILYFQIIIKEDVECQQREVEGVTVFLFWWLSAIQAYLYIPSVIWTWYPSALQQNTHLEGPTVPVLGPNYPSAQSVPVFRCLQTCSNLERAAVHVFGYLSPTLQACTCPCYLKESQWNLHLHGKLQC